MAMKNCKYPYCENPVKARGFCDKHHRRFQRIEVNEAKARAAPEVSIHEFHAVYVMGCFHFAPVKVGRANNVWKRLSTLQTGCPFQMFVFGARFAPPEVIIALEWEVHRTLTELDCHKRSEWFNIDPNDALAVIDKCADIHEYPVLNSRQYQRKRDENRAAEAVLSGSVATHTDMEMMHGSIDSAQKLLTQGANLDNTYL